MNSGLKKKGQKEIEGVNWERRFEEIELTLVDRSNRPHHSKWRMMER